MDKSPLLVARDEDRDTGIVAKLTRLDVPSLAAKVPVDYFWLARGKVVMGDNKTPSDFISSFQDGRLFEQLQAGKERGVALFFFLIEGDPWTLDGILVNNGDRAVTFEAFDDMVLSVQVNGGAKVVRSASAQRTPYRLKALYDWTWKEESGSWQEPVLVLPPLHSTDPNNAITDRRRRLQIANLLSFDGMGFKTAKSVLDNMTLADFYGVTKESLEETARRWKAIRGIGKKLAEQWIDFLTD